jgi:hypothetical protein
MKLFMIDLAGSEKGDSVQDAGSLTDSKISLK